MGIFSKLFNSGSKIEEPIQSNTSNNPSDFLMIVDDVFRVIGRGISITGRIESGEVSTGDIVKINNTVNARVIEIEENRQKISSASAGEMIALTLENVDQNMVNRNDTISK